MLVSNLRGQDGAGVVSWDEKKTVRQVKSLGNGIDLCNTQQYHAMKKHRPRCLIGHTRYPTKGNVDFKNTHPHTFDKVVGVHNGTMSKVNKEWLGKKDVSDSNLLYKAINDVGIDEAIENSSGAYALVWIDKEDQTLNFLRNDKRPLYFAINSTGSTLYWASEGLMLEFILKRAGEKFTIEALPMDTLVQFDLANVDFKLSELDSRKITGDKFKVTTTYYPSTGASGGASNPPFQTTIKEKSKTSVENSGSTGISSLPKIPQTTTQTPAPGVQPSTNVISMAAARSGNSDPTKLIEEAKKKREFVEPSDQDYVETRKGFFLHAHTVKGYLNRGCLWCGNPKEFRDMPNLHWITASEFVCTDECAHQQEVKDYLLAGNNQSAII